MTDEDAGPILESSDFRPVSLQGVLFTKPEDFSFSRSMNAMASLSTPFDSEPKVIGEMPDVPPDVPRLLYQSSTGEWRLSIAPARWDVVWSKPDSSRASIAEIAKKICDTFERYRRAGKINSMRCALVVTRVAEHPSPGRFLARHFCQDRWLSQPLNRPASFELHAHKQYELEGLTVNSWLRAKSGVMKRGKAGDEPLVLVEQDLNTPDANEILADDDIRRFFQMVPPELDRILDLYFPGKP